MAHNGAWSNPGGTPGMRIVKIDRDSEAWRVLKAILNDDTVSHLRISAAYPDEFTVKANEGMWSAPLDVTKEA